MFPYDLTRYAPSLSVYPTRLLLQDEKSSNARTMLGTSVSRTTWRVGTRAILFPFGSLVVSMLGNLLSRLSVSLLGALVVGLQ